MRDALVLLVELVVLFVGVAFVVALGRRRVGEERLRRWMGGRPVVAALKGIAVGFVTPFCTYSAIPLLVGLQRAGVTPAGYVAFIVAAPVLDPVLFGALVLIVGWQAALAYSAVAFVGALSVALAAERYDIARFLKPAAVATPVGAVVGAGGDHLPCDEACSPADDGSWRGLQVEASTAAGEAVALIRSMAPVLVVGVALGVAIESFVPAELVAGVAGSGNPFAIPIAAGLGLPFYVNTALFVPIADALASVGVGIGAIVALTIAGAGANLPEFVILSKLTRTPVLAAFVGFVLAIAMTGGLLAEAVTAATHAIP